MNLDEILQRATSEKWAVPHLNFSNLEMLKAIVETAHDLKSPVMVGVSEGERNFIGLHEAVGLVKSFREDFNLSIFLNADHTKSVDAAKLAVDAGFDSIHIDLSALTFGDNINGTNEIVEYAHRNDAEVSVEGELGYLRGESKVQKEKITVSPEDLTKPEEAEQFVKETGVNRFAGAYGNIHGISLDEPVLDIERIRSVRASLSEEISMVLHAGSGIPDDQIQRAIEAGISNIHISTELRVAYRNGMTHAFESNQDEFAPYKIAAPVIAALKEKVVQKIKLFGSDGKA